MGEDNGASLGTSPTSTAETTDKQSHNDLNNRDRSTDARSFTGAVAAVNEEPEQVEPIPEGLAATQLGNSDSHNGDPGMGLQDASATAAGVGTTRDSRSVADGERVDRPTQSGVRGKSGKRSTETGSDPASPNNIVRLAAFKASTGNKKASTGNKKASTGNKKASTGLAGKWFTHAGKPPYPSGYELSAKGKREIDGNLFIGYQVLQKTSCGECGKRTRPVACYFSPTALAELSKEEYEIQRGIVRLKIERHLRKQNGYIRCAECNSGSIRAGLGSGTSQ